MFADWKGYHFAIVCIHDGHHFAAATNEQPRLCRSMAMLEGRRARSSLPALLNFQGAGVNLQHHACVFQIIVDVP
jgi:hypothetical protein